MPRNRAFQNGTTSNIKIYYYNIAPIIATTAAPTSAIIEFFVVWEALPPTVMVTAAGELEATAVDELVAET